MTQRELNRAVAQATGESLYEIRRHGFTLEAVPDLCFDMEHNRLPPNVIDWDQLDRNRSALFPVRNRQRSVAVADV